MKFDVLFVPLNPLSGCWLKHFYQQEFLQEQDQTQTQHSLEA
jgi:hypothetical protein